MTRNLRMAIVASLLLLTCDALAGTTEGEVHARVEALQRQWVEAVNRGDVDAILDLYAEDAWFLPAGSPPLHGRDEIREWWEKTLSDPPWKSLRFYPVAVHLANGGDLAYDIGVSRTTRSGPDGETIERGKYLIVWERIGGEWKVVADAFNSD